MDNVQPLRPRRSRGNNPPTRRWRIWLLAALLPAVVVAMTAVGFWVDLLWFDELGQRDVLVTRLQWGIAMAIACGLMALVLLWVNFTIARRIARNDMYVPFLARPADAPDTPEQPTVPHFVMKPMLAGAAIIIALLTGLISASNWETVLRFMGRSDFGVRDPQFNHDVSFYVFTMPFVELALHFVQALIVVTALAVAAAYVAMGVIRYLPAARIARSGAVHLAALGAAFFITEAISFRLQAWNIVLSEKGVVTGAAYTDVHARLPGYWAMVVASLVVAVALVVFARSGRWRNAGYVVGGWFLLAVITSSVIPAAMQAAIVEPNQTTREAKVLRNNIKLTRIGFGLDKVKEADFADSAALTLEQTRENQGTISNLRLWSPGELKKALVQLQEFRSYYHFLDVDVDRYHINDQYRQVMLSAREMGPDPANSWLNRRLQYTHGYGVAMAWPNRATPEGNPDLLMRNIPPTPSDEVKDEPAVAIKRPEIYFGEEGEGSNNYVIVNSDQKEFDFPQGDKNVFTRYKGNGGIPISGFARRLALAATFGDRHLLLAPQLDTDSRFMFRRNIRERVEELAPFLDFDNDPYIVVIDGRLKWIVDAYTTTDRFPFSDRIGFAGEMPFNYMRNSVKAVVDAYDGDVTFYVVDDKDPLLKAWRSIFPKLFTSQSKMSDDMRAHLRYPEKIFEAQTSQWLRYHMGDSITFYNREDLWEVPRVAGETLAPFYVLAKLPGEKTEEMLLVRPMATASKRNMIGYMGARMDPGHYGELISYQLPKQTLTKGPEQVSGLIKQDPEVAEQRRLWESGDLSPVFGDLLVLPIENSLLYVQPVYLESGESQLPEFEKVVVVLGDTVAWGDNLGEALANLFRERASDARTGTGDGTGDGAGESTGDGDADAGDQAPAGDGEGDAGDAPPPPAGPASDLSREELQTLLAQVGDRYDRAAQCQREGDWECYGKEIAEVQRLLKQAGVSETAAPS